MPLYLPAASAAPTAHKTSHATGGSDALTPGDIGAGILRTPVLVSGDWFGTPGAASTGNPLGAQSRAQFVPVFLDTARTFDRIGLGAVTGVASLAFRLGVYAHDSATSAPGVLTLDAGTVDATASADKSITISLTLQPGIHWLVAVPQGAAPGANATVVGIPGLVVRQTGLPLANANTIYYLSGVTGALPDPAGVVTPHPGPGTRVMLRAT